ncbi:Tripartite DNA replication factor, partial [Podila humilis]
MPNPPTAKKQARRAVSSTALSSKTRTKQTDVSSTKLSQVPSYHRHHHKEQFEITTKIRALKPLPNTSPSIPTTSATSTPVPTSAPLSLSSSAAASRPTIQSKQTTSSIVKIKRPKTVIIDDDDDDDDEEHNDTIEKRRLDNSRASSTAVRLESLVPKGINRKELKLGAIKNKQLLPFEERMPVSPPGSPSSTKVEFVKVEPVNDIKILTSKTGDKTSSITGQGLPNPTAASPSSVLISMTKGDGLPDPSTPQRTTLKSEIASNTQSTPPRAQPSTLTPSKWTPQRTPTSNVIRTPTDTRRKGATFESLGLSPEDSVFWAKTPPMDAFKKLASLNHGRSHDEGEFRAELPTYLIHIASIVGRLYQNTSGGSALKSMDCAPKDRIRLMLDTLRGSSSLSDMQDDDDDDDSGDMNYHSSPTKNIASRALRRTSFLKELDESSSAPQASIVPRKRGRNRSGLLHAASSKSNRQPLTTSRPRPEVLKMIEQLKTNMEDDTVNRRASTDGPPVPKRILLESMVAPSRGQGLMRVQSQPILNGSYKPRTPSLVDTPTKVRNQARLMAVATSPDENDDDFLDFAIGADELEELTQLELSASMSAASSSMPTVSCPLSSRSSTNDSYLQGSVTRATLPIPKSQSGGVTAATQIQVQGPNGNTDDDLDNMADFFMDDDFDIDQGVSPGGLVIESAKYKRYRVESFQQNVADPRWPGLCTVINGQEPDAELTITIYLRESWLTTSLCNDDIVHTVGAVICSPRERVIDNANGYLVVRPDNLISTSILAESFTCIRKSIIDTRIIKPYDITMPLIHGNVLHELFQDCLRTNNFRTEFMEQRIESLIEDHLKELCLINESIDVAREALRAQIPSCQDWARRFLRTSPTNDSLVSEHLDLDTDSKCLSINKVLDIEENIWSPMFGLKGKIDATVQVTLRGSVGRNIGATLTVPFELKTGKKSKVMSHRAQTMLYTLLMTDRYDVDVRWGLLFYMKTGEFIRVTALRDEIRTIMIHRNNLAIYEERKQALPPMIKDERTCTRCFSAASCMVIHKLLEEGTADTSGIGSKFEELTGHLRDSHAKFLSKWNSLLTLEHGDIAKFRTQIWSMTSASRQASGNCFGSMILTESLDHSGSTEGLQDVSTSGPFGRHRYRFRVSTTLSQSQTQSQGIGHPPQTISQTLGGSHTLMGSSITVGDPIVVSSESQQYALAVGYVLDLSLSEVTVGLDRPLLGPPMRLSGFDVSQNQSYRGIYDLSGVHPRSSSAMDYQNYLTKNSVTFRIDKDEMAAGLARTRNNIVQLFQSDENGGDYKRRQLIVDLEAPVFDTVTKFNHGDIELNSDQRTAVDKVLSAEDYALILGMPGTGKTTTIVQIIRTLVARGKSVLLTSYTHSAVDNVLIKLHSDINIIRIGSKSKVHRDIQQYVPDFTQAPLNTVEAIHNYYGRCQVVGTTCLGIGDAIFAEKRFDYCIVDEASQITLPVCLGPIRYADVFVLVGDHNQLPPL